MRYIFAACVGAVVAWLFLNGVAGAEQVSFRNPIEESRPVNQVSRCANYALGAQLADAATTRAFMRTPGDFERDPVMRGLVRSDVGAYASAVALNLAARAVFRHSAPAMCGIAAVETAAVINNERVLGW